MPKNFLVEVEMPNGTKTPKTAQVGGTGENGITAERLAELYESGNTFPGAKSVVIHEVPNAPDEKKALFAKIAGVRGTPMKPSAVKTTPKPSIGNRITPDEPTETPENNPPPAENEVKNGTDGGRSEPTGPGRIPKLASGNRP